ncbi:FliA/WhiG family RNA polymerase sigma factor [Virgibacillus alimentarius]|uniref:RNA polymerase sigma factor for flagellar operon FliA n=2 Tax=Virgibacillus alimentarius TaxID=698769 RepID=A0ABS4S409_9BACI|nr:MULTISPECIES: FliA/WhiG family RNA polymerase sigma factor [Virgibacillus]MBP2256218.1 RNA polymerase sigma factor for flagellar operon FliA [Virgibacillus alimentarius]HLR66165.1 FliA/WhiG family RNA polymerase sigma factor [Virgibacillus sp.]
MKTNNSPLMKKLWKNWMDKEDNNAANELIQHYMYLVSFHVERIATHLPNKINKDDLKSFGLMGLYDALNKFETKRNLKFDTYASFRIRGAIIDGLRKEDWLPRSLREKTKKIENASEKLEQKYQREPTSEEIAKQLGITSQEVEKLINASLFANVLSIDETPKGSTAEGIGYSIPDNISVSPDERLVKNEKIKELIAGVKELNKNEQMIISLFYHDELTFTEIGQVLGLTTSRISQIHKKAIFKLRKILKEI